MSAVNPEAILGADPVVFTRKDIERRTLKHLQNWFVAYLARIERLNDIPARSLPVPGSWDVKDELVRLPEDALPSVIVVSTGTNPGRPPRRDGDGMVSAHWLVAIGAIVSANSQQASKDLAGFYGAAIREMMTEVPGLGGYTGLDGEQVGAWANGVQWEGEQYDDAQLTTERSIAAVRSVFTIEVQDVMNVFAGFRDLTGRFVIPGSPYDSPHPYPEVIDIYIETEAKAKSEPEEPPDPDGLRSHIHTR